MLLKDFTVYFLDFNVLLTLLGLFIWFTFLILNFLLINNLQNIFNNYIFKFISWNI